MKSQALKGVKVADFSWAGVGPMTARELAEHGATVIRVESHKRPDSQRGVNFKNNFPHPDYSGQFASFNTNKYGMTIDLNNPKSRDVTERLVLWADVVVQSMLPGVMERWGLGYEGCRKIKPDIIYASTCQHGQYGSYSQLPGFGYFSSGMAGLVNSIGWPDRAPCFIINAYTDVISPWYLVIAVVGALLHRRKKGEGTYIDQAQTEAGLNFMAPALLDYHVNGSIAGRLGNHDPYMVPHNAYPCRGNDRWVVIAISTEEEWRALCQLMAHPWTEEDRFASFLGRKENEEELDRLIGEWSINYTPEEVMAMLQRVGVPTGVVAKGEDLFKDPQLKHRQCFRYLEHKCIGTHAYRSPAYLLSETPCHLWKAAPCLGEDNLYVYRDILGYSEDEIADLIANGVITTEADLPVTVARKE